MEHISPRKTYYLKFRNLILILGIFEFVIALCFLFSLRTIDIFAGLVFLLNSVFMYSLATVRIVVSPNGISYHNMGLYSIHSTWENIDRIGLVNFRGFRPQRCVILKEGQRLGWWSGLAWAISKDERERTIPIPEKPNWNKFDELKNDIKTYIPEIAGLE